MSEKDLKTRKKREVFGANFKWNTECNLIAYCCFRLKDTKVPKDELAKKMNIEVSTLNNRIQHFNSLSENSKSKTTNPSEEVRMIFKTSSHLTADNCQAFIANFLSRNTDYITPNETNSKNIFYNEHEKYQDEIELEIDKSNTIENLNSTYLNFWNNQKNLQKFDMNKMPWNDFIKAVSLLNIKSRGMKIEKRILVNNATKLKKSIMSEEGDAWMENGDGLEIKTSFITPLIGSSVSLTGIRLWEEKVKFYFLLVIDISNLESDPITYAM